MLICKAWKGVSKLLQKQNGKKRKKISCLNNSEKLKKKVLEELCGIAFDDLGNYINIFTGENGEPLVEIKDSKDIDMRNISEITQNKSGFKFKLYNKETALVRLGNYLGLWKEKVEDDTEDMEAVKKLVEGD